MLFFVLLLLVLSKLTQATPNVNLLINAQVPPVARVNQAFYFLFAPSTFLDTSPVRYTLQNTTDWLQLDSFSGSFHGTPGPQDVGPSVVILVATDSTGSVTMPVTFIVSADQGPELGLPIASQLPAYGAFSSPDSLLLTPGSALSLSFSPNTFTNTNGNTSYYAKSADNTPLPSWVIFDPDNLSFSGKVPQATSPTSTPQTIGIQLTASDVIGFAGTTVYFQLVIQSHLFAFGNTVQTITFTPGSLVIYNGLLSDLTLDGQPVATSDLDNASADVPDWLSLDQNNLALSGTPPANASQQNFTVSATDRHGDSASTIVLIQTADNSSLNMLLPLPALNATAGSYFLYNLNSSFSCDPVSDGINIAVNPGIAAAWLTYNTTTMNLQGYIPSILKPQQVQVTIIATQGNQSQTEVLNISLGPAKPTMTHTTSGIPKATGSSVAEADLRANKHKGWIAAAVVVPLIAVIATLLLLYCCCRRNSKLRLKFRKEKAKRKEEKGKEKKEKISKPHEETNQDMAERQPVTSEAFDIDQEKAARSKSVREAADISPDAHHEATSTTEASNTTQMRASKLPKAPITQRFSRFRISRGTADSTGATRPDSWQRYVGGIDPNPIMVPEYSLDPGEQTSRKEKSTSPRLKPTLAVVPGSSISAETSPTKRFSKQRRRGSGMFSGQRVSGVGHGRKPLGQGSSYSPFNSKGVGHGDASNLGGPPGHGMVRKSWRNMSVISWTTTQSPPETGDSVVWAEGLARQPTQKTIDSILSSLSGPSATTSLNNFARPQTIHEAVLDERTSGSSRSFRVLSRSHLPSKRESPAKGSNNLDSLQTYIKRRRQQGSYDNPFWVAGPASARISSLQKSGHQRRITHGDHVLPSTPRKQTVRRSYSQSSSLGSQLKVSPMRTSSSPARKRIRNYHFARPFSPQYFSRSSRVTSKSSFSSSTDSRFASAASDFDFNETLHEDSDQEGNRRWFKEHPNPLRQNSTDVRFNSMDVSDQELINSLRADGQFSAAQRLSVLRAKTQGVTTEVLEADPNVEIRSPVGKRLGQ